MPNKVRVACFYKNREKKISRSTARKVPYQRDSLHIMFCVREVECDKIWQKRERTIKDALTSMCLRDLTFKFDSLSLSCDLKTRSFELSSPAQNSTAKPAVTGCDNKKANWGSGCPCLFLHRPWWFGPYSVSFSSGIRVMSTSRLSSPCLWSGTGT